MALPGRSWGLARHAEPKLEPPQGVEQIADVRAALERKLLDVFLERVRQQPFADEAEREERLRSVQNRVVDLLDSWRKIFDDYHAAGVAMQYQKYELKQPRPLLREMLDKNFESEHHRKFRANRSLRDVEPEVNLFLKDLSGSGGGGSLMSRKAHGQVRRGQVITTYGPGALIDLPRHSAIVGGLDTWPKTSDLEEILEPRLTRKLQIMTGVVRHGSMRRRPTRTPRVRPPGESAFGVFPNGLSCRRRAAATSASDPAGWSIARRLTTKGRFDGRPVVATRFVRACPKGHVDDLDWRRFVHGAEDHLPPTAVARRAWHER